MRVIIPATTDRSPHLQTVRDALEGVEHEVCHIEGDDGYWALLAGLWRQAETVVLVEHDVIASRAAIDDLTACGKDWCCARYPYGRGWIVGLGLTKFTRRIMLRVPDALDRAGQISDRLHPAKHWCRLDASVQRALVDSGETMCIAHPMVGHLNAGRSSHGCRG